MPDGYLFTHPKFKQFEDENLKTLYECRVDVLDLRTRKVVAECSAFDVDRVDAERQALKHVDAFMRKDHGKLQSAL